MTSTTTERKQVKSCVEAAKSSRVTIEEAWSELEREIGVRVRVYDKWVTEQKMSWADGRDRLARIGAASKFMKRLLDLPTEELAALLVGTGIAFDGATEAAERDPEAGY